MNFARNFAARGWLIALLIVCWQALSSFGPLDPLFFPPPSRLVGAVASLTATGELGREVGRTLARTFTGFSVGVFAGLALSVVLCVSSRLRTAAQPVISALYSTPRLTLLPMAMLLFGINDVSRILLVALSALLVVVIQVSDAVRAVRREYVDLAVNYGAGPATVIRRVYFPACLPQVFTAMRLSFGRALVITISVEMVSCNNGLGSMIWSAWQTFATEKLYVGIATSAALGLITHAAFHVLERRFAPWGDRRA